MSGAMRLAMAAAAILIKDERTAGMRLRVSEEAVDFEDGALTLILEEAPSDETDAVHHAPSQLSSREIQPPVLDMLRMELTRDYDYPEFRPRPQDRFIRSEIRSHRGGRR